MASCAGRECFALKTQTDPVGSFQKVTGAIADWRYILRLSKQQLQREVERLNAEPYSVAGQQELACMYLALGEARLASDLMQIELDELQSLASESESEAEFVHSNENDLELESAYWMAKSYLFLTLAGLEESIVEGSHECVSCDAYSMWPITGTKRVQDLRLFVRAMIHAYGGARELCLATQAEQVNLIERVMAAHGLIPVQSLDPLLWNSEGNAGRFGSPDAFAGNRTLMMDAAVQELRFGYDKEGTKRLLGEPNRFYPRKGIPYRWDYYCGRNWIGDTYWLQVEFGQDGMAQATIAKL